MSVRSRIFRQELTLELIWHTDTSGEPPPNESDEWEMELRGAVMQMNGNARVGLAKLGPLEELTPKGRMVKGE